MEHLEIVDVLEDALVGDELVRPARVLEVDRLPCPLLDRERH
jgi:hypothetical protein